MQKKLVLPGDFLSTEEEFVPGENAFYSGGNVYSGSIGHVEMNSKTKEISVKPIMQPRMLESGSIVIGRVSLVKENSVSLLLEGTHAAEGRQIIAPANAMIPVRNVSRDYVKNLRDCFRIGDIVKAKVTKVMPAGIDLATDHPELGVVKAFCARCRHPLHAFGASLRCMTCGSSETRKIASGYLLK